MSGRSPSAVASLRAKFEQQGDSTSPPSRGRSPAGSFTGDSSRPLSKVRTSFVAVEPSGRMGSTLEEKGLDGSGDVVVGNGKDESKTATMNGNAVEQRKVNGIAGGAMETSWEKAEDAGVEPTKSAENPSKSTGEQTPANPDKPNSAEDETAGIPQSDPTDQSTISGGHALSETTSGLGPILKGSPFQQEEAKATTASQPTKETPQPKTESSEQVSKAALPTDTTSHPSGVDLPKQTPTSADTTQTIQPPKKSPQKPSQASVAITSSVDGKPKDDQNLEAEPESKPKADPPANTQTEVVPSGTAQAKDTSYIDPSESKPVESPPAPKTPTKANKQPSPKVASPKQPISPKDSKPTTESKKAPAHVASRPVTAAKPPSVTTAPKPSTTSTTTKPLVKKPMPTSPTGFHKPRPKSPTRPVRLPASATAPTASSAAKLDPHLHKGPSRSPSRASIAGSTTSRTSHPRLSGGRASYHLSLHPGNTAKEKEKAKKPRASMASMAGTTRPAESSFLERMMRPTQASASKTHEKVEPKSPPRQGRAHAVRPKRKSEEGQGEGVKLDGEGKNGSEGKERVDAEERGGVEEKADPFAERKAGEESKASPSIGTEVETETGMTEEGQGVDECAAQTP